MPLIIEIVGWVGALCILGAYVLLTLQHLDSQSRAYQGLNVVGALGFVINSGSNGARASVLCAHRRPALLTCLGDRQAPAARIHR